MSFVARILHDKNISPPCRWLVGYLLSKNPHEEIVIHEIAQTAPQFTDKEMSSIFQEAVKSGYISFTEENDSGYIYRKYKLTVFENL
jgi:hypothetical protein